MFDSFMKILDLRFLLEGLVGRVEVELGWDGREWRVRKGIGVYGILESF